MPPFTDAHSCPARTLRILLLVPLTSHWEVSLHQRGVSHLSHTFFPASSPCLRIREPRYRILLWTLSPSAKAFQYLPPLPYGLGWPCYATCLWCWSLSSKPSPHGFCVCLPMVLRTLLINTLLELILILIPQFTMSSIPINPSEIENALYI